MHTVIVYQSSTGNTRLGVEVMKAELASRSQACEAIHVRDATPADLARFEVVGIATAVYAFQPAKNVQSFLRTLPDLTGKAAFAFCTCAAVPANTLRTIVAALEARGAAVLGTHLMIGEDSWPPLRLGPLTPGRGRPNAADLSAVRKFAQELTSRFEVFRSGETLLPPSHGKRSLFFHAVSKLIPRYGLRLIMLGKHVAKPKCTKCGKCVELCPTRAIELDPYPVFSRACMGCYGCVNMCPERAIWCPVSWGRTLYTGCKLRVAEVGS